MPPITQSFKPQFPFTAKLNPLHKSNWPYLLQTAIITRLVVGAARISENHPHRNQTTEMTPEEKKKAFFERCFVEIFGTVGYIFLLNLGQDLSARVIEHINKPFIPHIRAKAIEEIKSKKSDLPLKKFTEAFDEVMGTETKGIIGRITNFRKVPWSKDLVGSNIRSLADRMDIKLADFHKRAPEALTQEFRLKANRMFNIAIISSVFFSAILGGFGVQWLNDNVVNRYLKKRYPEKVPEGFLSLPANSNIAINNPFLQSNVRRAQ